MVNVRNGSIMDSWLNSQKQVITISKLSPIITNDHSSIQDRYFIIHSFTVNVLFDIWAYQSNIYDVHVKIIANRYGFRLNWFFIIKLPCQHSNIQDSGYAIIKLPYKHHSSINFVKSCCLRNDAYTHRVMA
jgi:hypothetical protein